MFAGSSTKEGSRGSQAPRNTCSLLTATIKPDAEASWFDLFYPMVFELADGWL